MLRKRGFAFILAAFLMLMLLPERSNAQYVDLTGGIKNEYEYVEYVFLTGNPVKFIGSGKDIKVTVSDSGKKRTETYNMKLTGPNGASLTRKYTYTYDRQELEAANQVSYKDASVKYSETIKILNTTFKLDDYQFSKSMLMDEQPANDYKTSEATTRKTYTYTALNGQKRSITLRETARHYGYDNYWGATDTQITEVEYERDGEPYGIVKIKNAHSETKDLKYDETLASLATAAGGWSVTTSAETMSEYEYDFTASGGAVGVQSLNMEYHPKIELLQLPKFRDITNSFARQDIEKLYSLAIYKKDNSNFFSPNTPMLRYDFAVAIGKAVDLRVDLAGQNKNKKNTGTLFKDVSRSRADYSYLVAAFERGIINGTSSTHFSPDGTLTREQAATMLVRALGLEHRAPDPGYVTQYKDDVKISYYARDAVYIAGELGLMYGFPEGTFKPKEPLTRAESSALLIRFLNYLEADLKQNYRDDIWFMYS